MLNMKITLNIRGFMAHTVYFEDLSLNADP